MMPGKKLYAVAAARVIGMASFLLLGSCFVTPGKFTSSMTINADRTFVFAYKGEVISVDPTEGLDKLSLPSHDDAPAQEPEDGEDAPAVSTFAPIQGLALALPETSKAGPGAKKTGVAQPLDPEDSDDAAASQDADASQTSAKQDAKNRAIVGALLKQDGFRSVVYRGNNVFDIDYEVRGRLDYSFVFPYNIDASIIAPFLAIEVRKDGLVRMSAEGFSRSKSDGVPGGRKHGVYDRMDGVFTLTTNAPIVSQNNEDGVRQVGGNSVMTWRVTQLKSEAPTVVLKLAPNPLASSPVAPRP